MCNLSCILQLIGNRESVTISSGRIAECEHATISRFKKLVEFWLRVLMEWALVETTNTNALCTVL